MIVPLLWRKEIWQPLRKNKNICFLETFFFQFVQILEPLIRIKQVDLRELRDTSNRSTKWLINSFSLIEAFRPKISAGSTHVINV